MENGLRLSRFNKDDEVYLYALLSAGELVYKDDLKLLLDKHYYLNRYLYILRVLAKDAMLIRQWMNKGALAKTAEVNFGKPTVC